MNIRLVLDINPGDMGAEMSYAIDTTDESAMNCLVACLDDHIQSQQDSSKTRADFWFEIDGTKQAIFAAEFAGRNDAADVFSAVMKTMAELQSRSA